MLKKCLYCKKEFNGRKAKKYCSIECNKADLKNRIERTKQTNLKKYGVTSPAKNKDVLEKIKQTNLEKYGVEFVAQNKEVYDKVVKTNIEKYGVENPAKNEEIKEKTKHTNRKKYGLDYYVLSEEFKSISKQTLLDKKGIESISYSHITNLENYNEEYIRANFIKDGYFLKDECCNYFNIYYTTVNNFKKKFNIIEPNKQNKTRTQQEIYDFIKGFYNDEVIFCENNVINPYELDIYIPDKKLAIEYDGLLYHSFGKSKYNMFNNYKLEKRNYHLQKTEMCEEKGIKLFHIFENEWLDSIKRDIWKSKIKLELGYINNKVDARKCFVKEVHFNEVKFFLENNHLQGFASSSINLGLYYKKELVEVMTFGKSRFNKGFEWELIRNCTLVNTVVRGGFSKLLNYFKKNYHGSIISYGNRRWTSKIKNVYGNNLINISKPNYFYFKLDDFVLYPRQSFQKHKLKDKLENFDLNLSETENMYNNGFRRIFDCGNLIYEI